MKNIVIIGGGFAGINVANKLAMKTRRKDVRILLIEPTEHNIYEPQYLFWSFKKYPISKFSVPIDKVLNKRVMWIRTSATKLDTKTKTIDLLNGESLKYDSLVLATGISLEEDQVGAYDQDNVHHFYSAEATKKLQKALENFEGGTIVISPSTVPFKCPPAPNEFTLILDSYLRKKKIRDKTKIKFLYPLMRPYAEARVAEKVQKLYDKRGIEFIEFFNYESVDKENNKIISLEGEEVEYDQLILIPPHEGVQLIKDSGLGDREGFVKTSRFTLKVDDSDNIYASGDCTNTPTSKSGAVAHFSAPVLVKNLLREMEGKEPKKEYSGFTICFVVSSFNRSMLLVFSYKFPPLKIGLKNLFVYNLFKKAFKILYFQVLLKGYM